MHKSSEILVIGTGLAGLAAALKLADHKKVCLLAKSNLDYCNSWLAQGGISAVMENSDSFASHQKDTEAAGSYLNRKDVVKDFVEQAPKRIQDLQKWGVNFDKEGEGIHLNLEGGHSHRRVLHIQDHTGRDIHKSVLKQAMAHENIEIYQDHFVIDLLTSRHLNSPPKGENRCLGAYVFDIKTGQVKVFTANHTILATGGAGKVYLYTSNWEGATGDGIALAFRAGCRVANMEFTQFHPTCLHHPKVKNFLITEALRGEGAELVNHNKEAFMKKVHPMGSLAPRDIVARGIDAEMKSSGASCVYLDIRSKDKDFLQSHFPDIYKQCESLGIFMEKDLIPVVPAAHYLCGGVYVDLNGRTDLANLYAIGETACTGFHGANRLASNSLLECTATAHNVSEWILKHDIRVEINPQEIQAWRYQSKHDQDELGVISHLWDEIRNLMWNYVGIVRSDNRLQRARQRLDFLRSEIYEYYWDFKMHRDILELRNISLVAKLTVACALKRKHSVGIHFNIDYPENHEKHLEDTIIRNLN